VLVTFEEYARHIDWALTVGRRRTRQTARQAASTMRERRPHGIRVNAVAPQLLDTPPNRATFPAEVMSNAVAPEAVADVIAFLVSDAAAPVSGAILPAYGA
jgi:NAD(P)-dependent dehydrogenase (short-subunit alcohol dehydrogenase family)